MPTTTAKMGLTVPALGDASPAHVSAVGASLALLDTHNHGASGALPTAAINVNAALPFGGFSAQQLRSLRMQDVGSPLNAAADDGSAFVAGGDLYFLDGNGHVIRLTSAGTINVGGMFRGDYLAYGALASYSHATRQYTFVDELTVKAPINAGILSTGPGGFGNSAPAVGAAGVSFLPTNTATNSTMISVKGDLAAQGGFAHTALSGYLALTQNLSQAAMRGPGQSLASSSWVAPRPGSVVGISYYYSGSQTAGTLSFQVLKNGAAFVTSSNFTSGQVGNTAFAKDAKAFAAGDRLTLVATTDANLSPLNHVVAYVHVEY
jgi:hypothetical protein